MFNEQFLDAQVTATIIKLLKTMITLFKVES